MRSMVEGAWRVVEIPPPCREKEDRSLLRSVSR